MPEYLIKHAKHAPVYAIYGSGKVRHIGQAEFAHLTQAEGGPKLLTTTDNAEYKRLEAEARVAQGYLQPQD